MREEGMQTICTDSTLLNPIHAHTYFYAYNHNHQGFNFNAILG